MFSIPLVILVLSVKDPDTFRGLQVAPSGQSEYWGKGGSTCQLAEGGAHHRIVNARSYYALANRSVENSSGRQVGRDQFQKAFSKDWVSASFLDRAFGEPCCEESVHDDNNTHDFLQLKPEPSDYWVSLPDAIAGECGSVKYNKFRLSNLASFLRSRPISSVLC